jgi:hypothetical protein
MAEELFDRKGIHLIDYLKRMMDLQRPYYPENLKYYQMQIDIIQANPACFTVTKTDYQGCGTGILHVHFFETGYIVEYKPGQTRWEDVNHIQYYPHTFTSEMLYAIKYLQIDLEDCHELRRFNAGLKIYKEHPECFHFKREETQSLEVERKILMEERQELESQKKQLRLERDEFQKNLLQHEALKMESELDEIILLKPRAES